LRPPLVAQLEVLQRGELGKHLLRAMREVRQRPVERKPVTVSLLAAGQNPVRQRIGREQGDGLELVFAQRGRRGLGEHGQEFLMRHEGFFPGSQARPQPGGSPVFFEAFAQGVILRSEEILAQIAQEMEVADQVGHGVWKDFFNRCGNSLGHIPNRGQGRTEAGLNLEQKGHDAFGFLTG